ncbi:MAG: hypothetical protein JWP55_1826, partial [Mycobacterium sp.]|nr:hypothetical protein [Mycobacterium sp.]
GRRGSGPGDVVGGVETAYRSRFREIGRSPSSLGEGSAVREVPDGPIVGTGGCAGPANQRRAGIVESAMRTTRFMRDQSGGRRGRNPIRRSGRRERTSTGSRSNRSPGSTGPSLIRDGRRFWHCSPTKPIKQGRGSSQSGHTARHRRVTNADPPQRDNAKTKHWSDVRTPHAGGPETPTPTQPS